MQDKILIKNDQGQEKEFDILFTFTSNDTGKDYITYTDYEKDEQGNIKCYSVYKAGENFLHLQKELADVESEISAARRIYSTSITTYNNKVQTFPSNIFASIFGYKTVEPIKFDVDDVQVKF